MVRLASGSIAVLLTCQIVPAWAEEPAVQPVRVCDIVQDPAAFGGRVVAVVGRYSFRQNGRFLSEQSCGSGGPSGQSGRSSMLPVRFDQKAAPKTPEHLEIGAKVVNQLLRLIQQRTALAKFPFGTPEYDRWAIVYGRVEPRQHVETVAVSSATPTTPSAPPGMQLICAGDGVVVFIVDHY